MGVYLEGRAGDGLVIGDGAFGFSFSSGARKNWSWDYGWVNEPYIDFTATFAFITGGVTWAPSGVTVNGGLGTPAGFISGGTTFGGVSIDIDTGDWSLGGSFDVFAAFPGMKWGYTAGAGVGWNFANANNFYSTPNVGLIQENKPGQYLTGWDYSAGEPIYSGSRYTGGLNPISNMPWGLDSAREHVTPTGMD